MADTYCYNHAVGQISKTRTSDFNHSGLLELLTEVLRIKRKSDAHRFWQQKFPIWFRFLKFDWSNSQFQWLCVKFKKELKEIINLKCTYMSRDISYKVNHACIFKDFLFWKKWNTIFKIMFIKVFRFQWKTLYWFCW